MATADYPVRVAAETNPELPKMALLPGVMSPLFGGRLIILYDIPSEGTVFCSHWNRYLFLIWSCLSCIQYFCQNTIHGIAHSTASDPRNSFHSKSEAMETCSWNPLFLTMFPHHPKAAGLMKGWNKLWRLSCSTSWVKTHCWGRRKYNRRLIHSEKWRGGERTGGREEKKRFNLKSDKVEHLG